MITQIVMPPVGDTTDEAKVLRWLKQEGDAIHKGDEVLEIETDKATLVVEAFGEGILRKIVVQEGETVPVGALLGIIASPEDDISTSD